MSVKSAATMILNVLFILCLFLAVSSSQSTPPSFQSVSGEFAQKWIKDFKEKNANAKPVPEIEGNKSEENGSDLWNWGNAPLRQQDSRWQSGNRSLLSPAALESVQQLAG